MRFEFLAAMAAAGLLASGPAWGQTARPDASINPNEMGWTWKICDGYGGPSLSGDGMTTYASTLFVFISTKGGDTFRKDVQARRESIAACDQDLADPLIRDRFPIRRASLLRAKAIHQIAANDPAGALNTLEQAGAVEVDGDEQFYRRSFGLGIDYVRAYALATLGDREAARALTLRTLAQRPYSTETTMAAAILLGRSGDRADARASLEARARLDPRRIDLLFTEALDAGRWADAVAIYPHLVPPRRYPEPPGYDFQIMEANLLNRALGEAYWASRSGLLALAQAQLGEREAAQATLAAARTRLDEAVRVTPPLEINGKRVKAKYLPDLAARLNAEIGKEAGPVLSAAAQAVAQVQPGTGRPLDDHSPAKPLGDGEQELSALLSSLPEVEIARRVPPYGPVNMSFFADDTGYTEKADAARGVMKIKYRARAPTAAVVEELALLRAANYALSQGRGGFVIVDRHDVQHTLSVSTYPGIYSEPGLDGYSVELEVVAVDPQNPPDAYRGAAWRVLDANAVVAALGPAYPPRASKKS